VILDRSVEAVVALLGIVKAGGAFVPIDPQMPLMRMTSLLDDAGIEIVVTDEDRAATLSLGDRQTVTSWTVDDPDAQTPAAAVTPGHLAYVIYTSGSTGMPKGVLVEHGSITHFVEMVREFFELTPDDRVAQCAALWFDVSVFEIFGALLIGASVHIAGDDTKLAPGALQHFFRDQAVTTLMTTPSLLEALDPDALPDLRVMSVGGEAFTADLTNRWAPGRRFINGYGPAEATVEVVAKVVTEPTSSAPPIGVPLAGHTAYALDHRMRRVPFGVPGELYVGGPGVARGYLGRPGQTGGVFVPDLFAGSPGERLYRTGDLVRRLPNGELQYLGRVDRQVKVRGMRVEPSEIEQWLLRHPAVSRVAVVSTRDHHGDTRLVGYVVCDGAADPEDIRSFGADWLPTHMVPAEIVVVSSIPTTSSGKVDVAALVAAQPQPAPAEQPAAPADVRTPLQRDVSAIVCDILGRDGIAVDDDLFAVGGNSLQVLRILSRVRAAYGVVLAPQDFFDDPTVDGICAAISAEPAHV
jgi:amino acid adenylation domain-containing protein